MSNTSEMRHKFFSVVISYCHSNTIKVRLLTSWNIRISTSGSGNPHTWAKYSHSVREPAYTLEYAIISEYQYLRDLWMNIIIVTDNSGTWMFFARNIVTLFYYSDRISYRIWMSWRTWECLTQKEGNGWNGEARVGRKEGPIRCRPRPIPFPVFVAVAVLGTVPSFNFLWLELYDKQRTDKGQGNALTTKLLGIPLRPPAGRGLLFLITSVLYAHR